MYQISTQTRTLVNGGFGPGAAPPQVYGDYVVWRERNFGEPPLSDIVWLYQVSTGTTTQLTAANTDYLYSYPYIYGDYVTWSQTDADNPDTEVILYQISTQTITQITDNTENDWAHGIDGDYLLFGTTPSALHLYQISTGQTQTVVESFIPWVDIQENTKKGWLADGRVIWSDYLVGQDLYLYDTASPDVCTDNLVVNGSFEDGLNSWTSKNLTADAIQCSDFPINGFPYGFSGVCGMVFKGSTGENSRLQQTIDLTGTTLAAGDRLSYGMWGFPIAENGKAALTLKVRVTYTDGTREKFSLPFPPNIKSGGWTMVIDKLKLTGTPQSMKVQIQHQSTKKEIWIDNIFVIVGKTPNKDSQFASETSGEALGDLIPLPSTAESDKMLGQRK